MRGATVRRFDVLLRAAVAVAVVAIGAAVLRSRALPLATAVVVLAVSVVAPLAWVGAVGVVAGLIDYAALPSIADEMDLDVRLTDVLLLLVLIVAVIRGRLVSTLHPLVPAGAVVVWGLSRTGVTEGSISFIRIVGPTVLLGFALPRLFRDVDSLWRVVRVVCVVLIATAPFLTTPEREAINPGVSRYSGIVGGPNELGLVGATLVALAWNTSGSRRVVYVGVGAVGLWQARSVSSILAAVFALIIAQLSSPKATKGRRVFSPLLLMAAVPTAVLLVPALRPDLRETLGIHLAQATSITDALGAGHPVWGVGWAQDLRGALPPGQITLHNTYLDWLAYLGLIGLLTLAAWFGVLARSADNFGKAALAAVVVWLNTSGAFPSVAWGILGLVAASGGFAHLRAGDAGPEHAAADAARLPGRQESPSERESPAARPTRHGEESAVT